MPQPITQAIILYEVFRIVCRQRGEDAALQAVALIQQGEVVELNDGGTAASNHWPPSRSPFSNISSFSDLVLC